MSIKRMNAVWDDSKHGGGELLCLLALADNAHEDGHCYPHIATVAQKARVSERTVIRYIQALEESGELFVERNRRRGNQYIVLVGLTDDQIEYVMEKKLGYDYENISDNLSLIRSRRGEVNNCQVVTSEVSDCHIRSDTGVISEVTRVSPLNITVIEPSLEPSEEPNPAAPDGAGAAPSEQPPTPKAKTPRDALWEYVLFQLYGIAYTGDPVEKTKRGHVNKVVAALSDKTLGATLNEVRAAYDAWELTKPRSAEAWLTMLMTYRERHGTNGNGSATFATPYGEMSQQEINTAIAATRERLGL